MTVNVTQTLQGALEKLQVDGGGNEIILDFSGVRRIDSSALQTMEKLAAAAQEKSVKVVLGGVNVDVYKVLKLMKLTGRFAFQDQPN